MKNGKKKKMDPSTSTCKVALKNREVALFNSSIQSRNKWQTSKHDILPLSDSIQLLKGDHWTLVYVSMYEYVCENTCSNNIFAFEMNIDNFEFW